MNTVFANSPPGANPGGRSSGSPTVETGVVMVVYLHEALEHKLQSGKALTNADVEAAAIEGRRTTPKA